MNAVTIGGKPEPRTLEVHRLPSALSTSSSPTFSSGERVRILECCSKPATEPGGCVRGRHVFYETDPNDLHARYPFSLLKPASLSRSTHLPVIALDCEMVYTTGGMRVARVSCVDGGGTPVLDEFVKMDEGVDVM